MELQGITYSDALSNTNVAASTETDEVKEDADAELEQATEDAKDLSTLTMSRKKRKLYDAMGVIICFFRLLFIY